MSLLSATTFQHFCRILALFLTLVLQVAAYAQTVVRVDGHNGLAVPNPPEGDTWGNAFKYLPDALALARANATPANPYHLWVAATIPSNPYRPDRDAANPGGTGLRQSTFLLDFNNIQVLGGFLGNETDPDDRDPALYETVLSGVLEPGCGAPNTGSCFQANGTPACDNLECCEAVCAVDPDCCEVAWDQACADLAFTVCGSCGDPGAGDCFVANGTPGCDDATCCAAVCTVDPDCCEVAWDQACADLAFTVCGPCGDPLAGDCFVANGTPGCDFATCCVAVCTVDPNCCVVAWDQACADLAFAVCGPCGNPGAGDCFVANGTPGCDDATCCEMVCVADPFCCEVEWDDSCAIFANLVCGTCGEPGAGSCFEPNDTPGCDDANCCALVCGQDPICCFDPWDQSCVDIADWICSPPLGGDPPRAYHVVTASFVDDTVRIDGVTITKGLADFVGSNGRGGGMFILSASPAVVRVTFTENSAPGHGGGAMAIEGSAHPLVVNCRMIANDAGLGGGGAMHIDVLSGSRTTVINSLFIDNIGQPHGGAIDARSGLPATLDLINCTITANSAPEGGGIWVFGAMDVNVVNSILWDNVPDQIFELAGGNATVTYSDVQGGWGVPMDNNIDDDPLFVDPANGDYRLDALSPCIDVGNPDETVIPCDQFDLDNDGITCDEVDPENNEATPDLDLGDRVLGSNVDMGPYESCPWDLDGDCSAGISELLILLAAWGPCADCGNCPADFDGDCTVGVSDLLELLANWGLCPCGVGLEPLSLAEELADACLTQVHWNDFVAMMGDPNASQEDKDRFYCWMVHYLDHCNKCTCQHIPTCPSPDPYT